MAAGLESQRMQQQQQQQAGKGRGGRLLPKSLFSQASCWLPHCHTHTCSPQNTKAADATTARELPTPRKATASSDDAEGVASGRTTAQLPARKKHGTRVLRNVYPPSSQHCVSHSLGRTLQQFFSHCRHAAQLSSTPYIKKISKKCYSDIFLV